MSTDLVFKISAGLKSIIGKELITNDNIAVFELVKNSYDAGAKIVTITFENIRNDVPNVNRRITILDDGKGMSLDDLKKNWLFVGYSGKKYTPDELNKLIRKKTKKRIFAGAKGIGRFSCDKLGAHLMLYSKTANEKEVNSLEINWKDFDKNQKNEFQKINATYNKISLHDFSEKFHLQGFKKGTLLDISELNEGWNQDKLIKLKRYLQRLINPSQLSKTEFTICIKAPEYQDDDAAVTTGDFDKINGPVKNVLFEKLGIKTTYITCNIDSEGKKITTRLVDKGNFIFDLEEENPYKHLREIHSTIFYLNRAAKHSFANTMGMALLRYGSIFLYKNGFRINPYGDPGDDWLRLEQRKAQGYKRFLSSRELLGRIEIIGYQQEFIETSSRVSGIVRTDALSELETFIIEKSIRRLERYLIDALEWENIPEWSTPVDDLKFGVVSVIEKLAGQAENPSINFNPDLIKIMQKKNTEKLPELIKNIEALEVHIKSRRLKKQMRTELKALKYAASHLAKEVHEKEKELLFLSDTKPGALDFKDTTHTIQIYSNTINMAVAESMRVLDNTQTPNKELIDQLQKIKFFSDKITSLAKIVLRATFDLESTKINKDLVAFISQYLGEVSKIYEKDIKIDIDIDNSEFVRVFKPIEMSIIIDNFISNSRKAHATRFKVELKVQKKNLIMRIYDNGNGLHEPKNLFKVGHSTTGGSGFGLYHVSKILNELGGTVSFLGNNCAKGYSGACFEVCFNG